VHRQPPNNQTGKKCENQTQTIRRAKCENQTQTPRRANAKKKARGKRSTRDKARRYKNKGPLRPLHAQKRVSKRVDMLFKRPCERPGDQNKKDAWPPRVAKRNDAETRSHDQCPRSDVDKQTTDQHEARRRCQKGLHTHAHTRTRGNGICCGKKKMNGRCASGHVLKQRRFSEGAQHDESGASIGP